MKECGVVKEKVWITLDMQDNRRQKHSNLKSFRNVNNDMYISTTGQTSLELWGFKLFEQGAFSDFLISQ